MLLTLSLVWGSTWIANSELVEPGAPLFTASLRYLLASVCLGLVCAGQWLVQRGQSSTTQGSIPGLDTRHRTPTADGESIREPDLKDPQRSTGIVVSLVLGCSMFALPHLLLLAAAEHGAGAWTPLIYAGLPLGLLLASGALHASAITGVGAMLVLLNGSLPFAGSRLPWVLPIVIAVALQGWSLMYAQRNLAAAASPAGCMVQCLMAAVVLGFVQVLPGAEQHLPLRLWPHPSLGALTALAGVATAAAYPLYYSLLRSLTPAQMATSEWLQTLVAVSESAMLLRLRPSWAIVSAACILVGCTALLLRQESGDQVFDLNR